MSETFALYESRFKPLVRQLNGHAIHLEPRMLLGETPVCFFWTLAHPTSGYYMEDA